MINFLIADDHAFLRRGLKLALQEEYSAVKIIETETGRATIEAVKTHQFDLVVLDINFPDINGIDVLKQVKLVNKALPVIIFTFYPEEQYAIRAFDADASGYLTKDSGPDEFISTVSRILGNSAEAR